jgi:CDGSH-type Zn-finger protein
MSDPDIGGREPIAVEKNGKVFFCTCERSGKKPLCDGSHKKL